MNSRKCFKFGEDKVGYFFIRYFIKGDVLCLYRYFMEGHVSLVFS